MLHQNILQNFTKTGKKLNAASRLGQSPCVKQWNSCDFCSQAIIIVKEMKDERTQNAKVCEIKLKHPFIHPLSSHTFSFGVTGAHAPLQDSAELA